MATQPRHAGCQPDGQIASRPTSPTKRAENIFERWQALIIADREGDAGAYDVFLAELRTWLTRYFSRRMRDGGVEDAVQETLIAVFLKRPTYSTDDALGPWLMTIAYRKWVDSVRRRARATLVPLDDNYSVEDHGDALRSAILIEDCLSTLKRPQRDVIVHRLIDGFSVADTADMTGQSESLVKVNVHRGLRRMAASLSAAG